MTHEQRLKRFAIYASLATGALVVGLYGHALGLAAAWGVCALWHGRKVWLDEQAARR